MATYTNKIAATTVGPAAANAPVRFDAMGANAGISLAKLSILAALLLALAACSNSATNGGQSTTSGFTIPIGGTVTGKDASSTGTKDVKAGTTDDGTAVPQDDATGAGTDDATTPQDDAAPGTDDADQPQDDSEQPQNDAAADPPAVCATSDEDQDGVCACADPQNTTADCDCDDNNPNFATNCPACATTPGIAGCLCKGGAKPVGCYDGDPNWLGKGSCVSGQHLCQGGFWSVCQGETFPEPEKCDGKDNDCDGETDEGVKSTCGTCDLTCNEQKIGADGAIKWNLNSENSTGLGLTPQGDVTLDTSQISLKLKFIWLSNSSENTVSKVDCKTAKEVGRYKVCNNPSRTSVDLDGNVYASCRGDGRVAKIMAEKKDCIDKNGNGVIDTATDSNGDGNIQPNEMNPGGEGADECVAYLVQPLGQASSYPGSRGAAVDKFNNVYIGYWNEAKVAYLESKTGNTLKTVNWQCPTYGLVVDQKGYLWGQGNGCDALMMYSPTDDKWFKASSYSQNGISAYGINVDGAGRIWVGGSLARYNPADGSWLKCNIGGAGIATTNNNMVYIAKDGGGIGKVDGETCKDLGTVNTGGSPHGVAVDFDGFVWGVNLGGNSVDKIDPGQPGQQIGALVTTRPIGQSPYTYSDMTGYTLNYFTAPKGQFTTVFFGGIGSNPVTTNAPKQVWQSLSAEADLPEGTNLRIRMRAANNSNDLELAKWSEPVDFPPEVFPYDLSKAGIIGNLLQVEVQLLTKDKKLTPALKSLSAKSKLM